MEKNKALELSVLMCVYKEPTEWIDDAIGSILNQTFRDFEFLIINDNFYPFFKIILHFS